MFSITPELVVTQQIVVGHPGEPRLFALDQQQHLFISSGLPDGARECIDSREERIERESLHFGTYHIAHDGRRIAKHGRGNHGIDIGLYPTGTPFEQRIIQGKCIAPLGINKVVVGLSEHRAVGHHAQDGQENRTRQNNTYYLPLIHILNQLFDRFIKTVKKR